MVKNPPANARASGDLGSIPESGRSPAGINDNLLQYPLQDNPRDKGAWLATVCGVTKSQIQLSMQAQAKRYYKERHLEASDA